MKKTILTSILILACAGSLLAAPSPEKTLELRGYLLEKGDLPFVRMKSIDPSKWMVMPTTPGGPCIGADSLIQTIWKTAGQTEITVETAIFATREDALKAAEGRVKELKESMQLEAKTLKGGQLPGQSAADKIWGLYDPPEPDWKTSTDPMASPHSHIGAIVFVKKEVCIQVKYNSLRSDVHMEDLESVAKKISTKIKPKKDNTTDRTNISDAC